MTIQEAFQFKAGPDATAAIAAAALQFAGLDPAGEWSETGVDKCKFYGALCDCVMRGKLGIKQMSEGGYSVTYDSAERSKYAYSLAMESGCKALIEKYNPTPKIQDKTYMW